jgi:hypothetical protein
MTCRSITDTSIAFLVLAIGTVVLYPLYLLSRLVRLLVPVGLTPPAESSTSISPEPRRPTPDPRHSWRRGFFHAALLAELDPGGALENGFQILNVVDGPPNRWLIIVDQNHVRGMYTEVDKRRHPNADR